MSVLLVTGVRRSATGGHKKMSPIMSEMMTDNQHFIYSHLQKAPGIVTDQCNAELFFPTKLGLAQFHFVLMLLNFITVAQFRDIAPP